MNNFIKDIIKSAVIFFVFGIVIIAIMSLIDNKKTYTVVEQNVEIQKHNDSLSIEIDNNIVISDIELQKHNDSLRIEVDNLDSIKNAKVIEVKTLDNDSTVKLFYQLIK